jgi:hypothetical protein
MHTSKKVVSGDVCAFSCALHWIIFIGTEPCGETALALDKTITDNIFYPKRFTLYKEI